MADTKCIHSFTHQFAYSVEKSMLAPSSTASSGTQRVNQSAVTPVSSRSQHVIGYCCSSCLVAGSTAVHARYGQFCYSLCNQVSK